MGAPLAAHAQSAPFTCDGTVFISQGDTESSTLFTVDSGTNPFTLNAISPREQFQYNAIGFNVIDGLIYGVVRSNARPLVETRDIIAIDANGKITNFGSPNVSTTSYAGDIDENGIFFVVDGTKLYAYDTQAANFPNIMAGYPKNLSPSTGVGSDIAYSPSDGFLYGFQSGKLIKVEPATAKTTKISISKDLPTASAFGAMWFDARGDLYGYQNNRGIYRINMNTFISTYVSSAATVSTNDGTGCAYAPILEKTASQAEVIPGATFQYSFVIVNGFRQSAMPFGFTDTLPGGFSFVDGTLTVQGASSSGTANSYGASDTLTIQGMEVPAAGTVTIQVDVQVSFDATSGPYYNQAYLTDLYPSLGGTIPSDWPASAEARDPTRIDVVAEADIDLVKQFLHNGDEDGSNTISVGDTLTYEFMATNMGAVRLRNVEIVDPLPNLSALSCLPSQPTILLPGEQMRCTATYVVAQPDLNRGRIDNMATVGGADAVGIVVRDSAAESLAIPQRPSLELDKLLANNADEDDSGNVSRDDTLTYQFELVNNGSVTLFDVAINDPLPGLSAPSCIPNLPTTLAPGATATCTAQYAVTQADVDEGEIINTATATGVDSAGNRISDSDTHLAISPQHPSFELTKGLLQNADNDGNNKLSVNDLLTYEFIVHNDGNVTLDNVTVADALPGIGNLSCTPALGSSLLPDAQMRCTATYRIRASDVDRGTIYNRASARAQPPVGTLPDDESALTLSIPQTPAIELTKTLKRNADQDQSNSITRGDRLTYEFIVTNRGNVTLSNVAVSDPLPGLGTLSCAPAQPATLAPNGQMICSANYLVTQGNMDSGFVDNTATTSGTAPGAVSVQDMARLKLGADQNPAISLDKAFVGNADEDRSNTVSRGDTLSYRFDVENTGNMTLKNVHVTDALIDMSGAQCTPAAPAELAPGQQMVCTAAYVAQQTDIDNGSVINRALASGETANGGIEQDRDVEGVSAAQAPAISLRKRLAQNDDADGSSSVSRFDTLTYQFVATNEGNVSLTAVQIVDPLAGLSALTCSAAQPATLMPSEALTCTAQYVVTQADVDDGIIHNAASVTARDPNDKALSATAMHDVVAEQFPSVALQKYLFANADEDGSGSLSAGDTITYHFDVVNDGTITLYNVTVTDPLPGLSRVTCSPAQPAVLGAGDTMLCAASYQLRAVDLDADGLQNEATVRARDQRGNLLSDSDSEIVPASASAALELTKSWVANADEDGNGVPTLGDTLTYQFVAENSGGVTLRQATITDPMPGLSALACSSPLPATLLVGQIITCTATYGVSQADADRGSIANTATLSAIDVSNNALSDMSLETVPVPQSLQLEMNKSLLTNRDEDGSGDISVADTLTYQLVATNHGYLSISDVEIVDPLPGLSALSCSSPLPTTLDYTEAITCTATYVVEQSDVDAGEILNTATITGTSPYTETTVQSAVAVAKTTQQQPELAFLKALSQTIEGGTSGQIAPGDMLTYTFMATNTGNVTLRAVEVYDAKPGLSPLRCAPTAPTTLAPTEGIACTATYTVTQADMDRGVIQNSASVSGFDPTDRTIEKESSTSLTIDPEPEIMLAKRANVDPAGSAGSVITYTFTTTNLGNVTLANVQIEDPLDGLGSLRCTPAQPVTLAPQQNMVCQAVYPVKQGDIDAGELTNRATVSANAPAGTPVQAEAEATVEFPQNPLLTFSKTVMPTAARVGDTVTFTMIATNAGNVTIEDVLIEDPLPGLSALDCTPNQPAQLAPNERLVCTATYKIPRP